MRRIAYSFPTPMRGLTKHTLSPATEMQPHVGYIFAQGSPLRTQCSKF